MAKMLWQLKRLSTNESLSDPQELPKNWKNIFGLKNHLDKLGDLSWAGHKDMGWFEIGPEDPEVAKAIVRNQIQTLIKSSDEYVAIDNKNITKGERADWMEYRRKLNEIHLQPGYPDDVFWPKRPDAD